MDPQYVSGQYKAKKTAYRHVDFRDLHPRKLGLKKKYIASKFRIQKDGLPYAYVSQLGVDEGRSASCILPENLALYSRAEVSVVTELASSSNHAAGSEE